MAKFVLPAADAVARARSGDRGFAAGLRPVIVGPRAGLHRFSVTGERALLGEYDPLADTDYAYPDRESDSVIDRDYTKLYASTLRLNYFNKYVGVGGSCQPSSTSPNRVRAANYVFKTANDVDRSADFYDRDVKIGDEVDVRGVDGVDPVELSTVVTGFVGEVVASTRAAATADDNNVATQTLDVAIEQVADTPFNDVVATANAAAYDSLDDGYINRTYTITVTQSSTGGDATTALLRVRSADGGDDDDDVAPAAFSSPTAIGAKGLTVTFAINSSQSSSSLYGIDEDDLVVGQQWTVAVEQAFTAPTATSAGTYTGTRDTTYVVTVSRGGLYAGATKPQISVTTTNGYDQSGPTNVTASAGAVAVGNYGVTVAFNQTGLRSGDKYYIVCEAEGEGAIKTLVLRDDVPEAIRGTEVDLRLFARRTSVEIPKVVVVPVATDIWSETADEVTVESGMALTDDEFTDGGDPVAVDVSEATLYVEYREWVTEGFGTKVSIADPDDIEALLGTVDPDNPVAYAASMALANTHGELSGNPARTASATTDIVFCLALGGDPTDFTLWESALETLENEDEAYHIVPLTTDAAVLSAVSAHVSSQSDEAVGFFRCAWVPSALDETDAVVSADTTADDEPVTATIAEDPDESGAYTIVTASANAAFVTTGVRAGDVFRTNYGTDDYGEVTYDEYEVEAVISETTLRLVEGPDAAVSVAVLSEVWRAYTKDELISQLTALAATYDSDRVRLVWPDRVGFGGTTLAGYNLCAALAGLAGSVPSQQGLRSVGVAGVDDVTRSSRFFTNAQLQTLAAGGVFVVTQTPDGRPYVAYANTTDPSSVATREEMIVRNADMIKKAVQDTWAPYVGSGNVVSNIYPLLEGALITLVNQFRSGGTSEQLGPPVGDITIASLTPVSGSPDTIAVTLNVVGIPVPLNQIRLTLPISL